MSAHAHDNQAGLNGLGEAFETDEREDRSAIVGGRTHSLVGWSVSWSVASEYWFGGRWVAWLSGQVGWGRGAPADIGSAASSRMCIGVRKLVC